MFGTSGDRSYSLQVRPGSCSDAKYRGVPKLSDGLTPITIVLFVVACVLITLENLVKRMPNYGDSIPLEDRPGIGARGHLGVTREVA